MEQGLQTLSGSQSQTFLNPTSTSDCTLIALAHPQHLDIRNTAKPSSLPERKTDIHKGFVQSAVYHYGGIMSRENLINLTCNSLTQKAPRKLEVLNHFRKSSHWSRRKSDKSIAYGHRHLHQTTFTMNFEEDGRSYRTKKNEETLDVFSLCRYLFSAGVFALALRRGVLARLACCCSSSPSSCH